MSISTTTDGGFVDAFAQKYIVQTKGRWAGKPLELEKWQRDLVRELFLKDASGRYVYREAAIGVPRKNGKSTSWSCLALYALMASGEQGAEVYAAAASRDQARIVFNQAVDFIAASPALQDWLKPQRSVILCEATGSRFRVLSSDAPLQFGLNPSFVVIDELWAHSDPELYYALTTGQLARENPLVVSITTSGYDMDTICGRVYEQGRRLSTREAQRKARFLFQWHQAPDGCDLDDTQAWREANPSKWIKISDLRRERERLPRERLSPAASEPVDRVGGCLASGWGMGGLRGTGRGDSRGRVRDTRRRYRDQEGLIRGRALLEARRRQGDGRGRDFRPEG